MATVPTGPPRLGTKPVLWVRENLFNTWYNLVLTILAIWLLVALLRPAAHWAFTEARWGVIKANMTLFMVGQYPRDQLWRIWLAVYLLAALIGLSWGVWPKAVRNFAIIALSAAVGFAAFSLLQGWNTWIQWLVADLVLAVMFFVGPHLPRASQIAVVGWLLYFPVFLLLVAGSRWIPALPPVEMSLWGGLLLTLVLTVVGNLGALPIGILLALGRRSKLPAVRYFCTGYIEIIRGVPLITILYMVDVLLPLFLTQDVRPDRVLRAMVGLMLFEAAYQAENVRGGLQSVPHGQYEAAHALGLNAPLTMVLVILPQALRAVIPALLNSFISLFKDTTLVAIIGLFDLLRIGRSILAQPEWLGTHREIFLFAFFVYWAFSLTFAYGSRRIEMRLGVGKR